MQKRKPYRDGKVHVCKDMCSTCIFRPGNLMMLQPGRVKQMIDDSIKGGSAIICHSTLDGDQAVCFGFYTVYKDDVQALKLADILKVTEFQDVK